tara:strand:+ start:627 stop:866 length:240 start_codon:yes stop_codon:yes gene_type:complete
MASKSTRYYRANPKAKAVKAAYRKKYNRKPAERRRRSKLMILNRKMGKKGDGKDVSHKKGGGVFLEKASKNRARNRGKA